MTSTPNKEQQSEVMPTVQQQPPIPQPGAAATTTTTTTTISSNRNSNVRTPNRRIPHAPTMHTTPLFSSVKQRPTKNNGNCNSNNKHNTNNSKLSATTTPSSTRKNPHHQQKHQLPHYMTPTKSQSLQQSSSSSTLCYSSSLSQKRRNNSRIDSKLHATPKTAQPQPKRLYLIRHGESMGQAATRLGMNRQRDERLRDAPLTRQGIWQAQEQLRPYFENQSWEQHAIELVVSSPLTRALHTAILGFPSYYKKENNTPTTNTNYESTPTTTNGGGGGGGKKILIHYDLAEIGSRVPENTPRPIKKVLADIDYIQHQNNNRDGSCSASSIVDYTTLLPDTWPTVLYDGNANRHKALRRAMIYLYQERSEQCIAIVCHYNVIRQILGGSGSSHGSHEASTNTVRPQNAVPIPCELRPNGEVVMIPDDEPQVTMDKDIMEEFNIKTTLRFDEA